MMLSIYYALMFVHSTLYSLHSCWDGAHIAQTVIAYDRLEYEKNDGNGKQFNSFEVAIKIPH